MQFVDFYSTCFQMVGLYKDPEGNDITTFAAQVTEQSNGEVVELRRRISELENTLKKQVCM